MMTASTNQPAGNVVDDKVLNRLFARLERLDTVTSRLYSSQRGHQRVHMHQQVTICLPAQEEGEETVAIPGWTRDISRSGMSFLTTEEIKHRQVVVGLPLPEGKRNWVNGTIVRARPIEGEKFWEYGVAFSGRATQ